MPAKRKDKIGSIRSGTVVATANLAAGTAVGSDMIVGALQNAATVLKAHVTGRFLPDALTGPLEVFLTVDELSDAQVEEYIELDGPTEPGEVTSSEVISRGRYIKSLGVLPHHGEYLVDGPIAFDIEESLTLTVREGKTPRLVAYNHGIDALGASSWLVLTSLLVVRWHAE